MQSIEEFEAWIKERYEGQQGLAAAFLREFGEEIGQPAISGWISKKKIPVARWKQMEKLGWPGPYSWEDVAITREEMARALEILEERLKGQMKRETEIMLEALRARTGK